MMKKLFSVILVLALLVTGLAGCSRTGKAMMTLDGITITKNEYELMLSIRKGEMAYAINAAYGSPDSAAFWGTVIDENSTTYETYYNDAVTEKAKNYLAALALYEDLGLTLSKAATDAVDEEMETLVAEDGEGSKSNLNGILAAYGANYDILREYKIMNAKVAHLAESLYGANGSKIAAGLKENYLRENYVAFKQILLSNFYYVYKTDKNGDEIRYTDNGAIAYDTEKGIAKLEDGEFVYYTEDGRIAYDTVNGKPSPVLDSDGNMVTKKYTSDEMIDRLNLAIKLRDIAEDSPASVFEEIREAYSDEEMDSTFDPDALSYLAVNVDYRAISSSWKTLDDIADAISDKEIGELAIVQTDAGIHLVRKYAPEEGAYENAALSSWFSDTAYGVFDFITNLKNSLLSSRLSSYVDRIVIDEELRSSVTIKTVSPNYYYR